MSEKYFISTDPSEKYLISMDSLEAICVAIASAKDEDGKYIKVRPKEILQEWALEKLRIRIPGDMPDYLKEYILENFGD